ncbi:MAG: hypothetical protein LCI02_00430 [Proteobacteria bacterium]|nr:hypothetical protein [Pseudomonadota bacterium]
MLLLGFIWVLAAPLLLLLPFALLARLLHRARPQWPRRARWGLAAALTAAAVLALWLPARLRFAQQCAALGAPHIDARAQADGFFLDDSTANSFGMRYLQEEGFAWIEARSIYRRGGFTRYRKAGERIEEEEIDALTAAYVVKSQREAQPGGISTLRTTVSERASGRVLASAASARFDGGAAKWVLGIFGDAQCPNLTTSAGSAAFRAENHLARDTLRGP